MELLLDPVKNEVQSLVNLVKNEAQYLCCFNSYVENFEQKKSILAAKHKDVNRKFQKGKGVFSFKFEAQQWKREADDIIHIDTKVKQNWFFGWCPNCWSQYRTGKKLAKKTQHIEKLLERCNSNIVAGRANVLDIKYLSSQGFIHFESRESKFQDLLKALKDENCNMIGLQGLGGTGKTSMAKEVGHKLKESKLIDKFIFLVVSQPPDFKKIRGELAKDLNLDEVKEEELSSTILSKITNMDQKLLIILDDVWAKFDLTEDLGIPFGHHQKGCNLLITTRSSNVCTEMRCHQTIQLQILTNEEALNLFKAHASLNNSSRGFKGMPQKIVKHCGGVPVAIVALARALNNKPISAWKDALKSLEDGGLGPNLEVAYKCLKLSYDNLKSQKAKELLLISSLFPEDCEIPVELLIKIGIGLGSFNENDKYHLIRNEVHGAIMELIHSSLFLNVEEECVKMHDLVREVALWIGENDIQSLLDLEKPIKGNLKYIFWKYDKFPDEIDGTKLEYLSIMLDDSKGFNVKETFFEEMTSIKVLIVDNVRRVPARSLTNSLHPLKSVQTLFLTSMKLGDISVLGNLLTLMTLWFYDCSIIELPKEFLKLKKLRSLEVNECKIKRNNPFEVIEMCSQLQELTFVGNECDDEAKDAISHDGSPLTLHRYCISSKDDLSCYSEKYGLSRCFRVDELSNLVSHATFKQLVERAEVLSLEGEDGQRMWKNLVPDIVPIDKEVVMNDLIVLQFSSYPNMECLIDTKDHDPSMSAFCNLVELHLSEMGVEGLCRGPPPSGFLEQLEILTLTGCSELKSILFNASYNLGHLESMELKDCPKLMSVFKPYTARSLIQLKKLTIQDCSALEYITAGEDGDSNQKNYYESLLPSLEKLKLSGVPSFIGIVREYHQLMSSSMHKQSPPLSRHNSNDINQSIGTRAFSLVQACCSPNKSRPASKETNIAIFEDRSLDHTNPLGLLASKKWIDTAPTIGRQLVLQVRHIRKMVLASLSINSVSKLFTLSMASMISWEELEITEFDGLKHLVTSEDDDYKEQISCHSIFPKLKNLEIWDCKDLEFLFLSSISIEIKNLKSLTIVNAPKLTHVVGKYQHHHCISNHNQNDELHFDLPALETLRFEYVPEFIAIVYSNTTKKFDATIDRGAHSLTAESLLLQSLKNVKEITLLECHNLISLSTLSIATSTIALETLTIQRCHKLKCITTHEGDAQVDRNNCSIFPTLEKLIIKDCKELEFLSVSAISVGLQKLKSLTIWGVPKLKCAFGNYQKEQHSSNQNQNDELHFDLPALETLSIGYAPKINGIFANNYSMVNWTATEEVYASTIGALLFHVTQKLFKNISVIELVKCTNLISLTTPSIASIILLEVLTITKCGQLKCIVGDEGDVRAQINYNPIFPKLKRLDVSDCDALEYLFLAYTSRSPIYLESLKISHTPMLKYVFGRSQHDDSLNRENQNIQILIDFPALKDLSIEDVSKLVSIYPENYYMRGLYLRSVVLKELPEFTMKPFNEFLVCWHTEQQETMVIEMCWKTLESLEVGDFKIEEIFDLTYMGTKEKADELQPLTSSLRYLKLLNLSELVNICVGPKCIIRFDSLRFLTIKACKKLRVIFSASIVRSLSVLMRLDISECEELVHLVEEDYETNADDHVRHEPCFPNLGFVSVSDCDKLKYLFSITISDILPKLYLLKIYNANELEHVLIKRDEMEEIVMKDVLPQLRHLTLSDLPKLISVCHGINFQKQYYSTHVDNCPNFGTSTTQYKADLESGNSQVEEKAEERLSSHIGEEITQQSFTKVVEARAKGVSTSLNQAPSSILSKSYDGVDHGDIKEAGMVQKENNSNVEPISLTRREQELSYSKGQIKTKDQLTDSQPMSAMPTTPFVNISQDEHSESDKELNPSAVNRTDSQKASSKDELEGKVARNERIKIDPQQSTMDTQNFTKDELVGKEVQKETIMMEPQSQEEMTGHDIHFHKEEEEEREDDVQLPNKSQSLAIDSSGSGNLVLNIMHPINSLEDVNNEGINEASVVQNESKTNVACRGDQANPSNITEIEQETSHSRGRLVESRDCTESNLIEDTKLSVSPFYTPIEIMPSFLETNNEASIVPGMQEIIHMMELEGFEGLIFAKALETRPQLQLSTKDRSPRVLCMSYKVLLDILNILTTKTPFTITEADKRLLAEHLKDAYLLGFDKDWIESIKTKVFDSGISEVESIQKVLKGLDNDLKSNKAMLEAIRDEEVEAARVVEVAQQEHANVMARHAHLLKERQDIIARRHQCWEIISAKNRHFGF